MSEQLIIELYEKFFERLCRYAFYILNNKEMAEEVVQDFFVILWTKKDKIHFKCNDEAYLFISVRNLANNFLKKSFMVSKKYNQYQNEEDNSPQVFNETYFIKKLNHAITMLPEKCRLVYCLKYFEGLTYKEIAAFLKITEKTVDAQIYKALIKLRKELGPYKYEFYSND